MHELIPQLIKRKRMGIKIKSLSLQLLLPLCFHLPQLPSSTKTTSAPPTTTIKLIASDGQIKTFNKPIPASTIMKQNPLHLICRSDAFFLGQKVSPLSPDDSLQPGQSYFLLPSHFFHSVLSFVTLMSSFIGFVSKGNGFDVTKTEKGIMLKLRMKEEEEKREERVCTSEELKKEYKQLVNGGCKWKPRLEMIRERRELCSRKSSSVLILVTRRKKKKV